MSKISDVEVDDLNPAMIALIDSFDCEENFNKEEMIREEKPRVNRTVNGRGEPVFPNMRIDIFDNVGAKQSTIKFFTQVRVADEEGSHYFTTVMNEYPFLIPPDTRGRVRETAALLSKQIQECTTSFTFHCYGMIMCGKPDGILINPTTGRPFFEPDDNNQNERERMFEVMHPLQAAAEAREAKWKSFSKSEEYSMFFK